MLESASVAVRWRRVPEAVARREIAWELLRELRADPAARVTNTCDLCGGPHGRVRVMPSGVQAAVTYAGGYAVVCVAPDTHVVSLGIDAEPMSDARRDAAGLTGIVRPGAVTTVREWTRIEAVLKADGRGLRVDPAAVAVLWHGSHWSATIDGSLRAFLGADVDGPPGVILSVAFEPVSAAAAPAAAAGRARPSAAARDRDP